MGEMNFTQINRDPVKWSFGKLVSCKKDATIFRVFIWGSVTKQTWQKWRFNQHRQGWICHRWFGWCFRCVISHPLKMGWWSHHVFRMAKSSDHIVLLCENPCSPRFVSVAKLKWELHTCPVTIFEFFGHIHSYSAAFPSFSALGKDQI